MLDEMVHDKEVADDMSCLWAFFIRSITFAHPYRHGMPTQWKSNSFVDRECERQCMLKVNARCACARWLEHLKAVAPNGERKMNNPHSPSCSATRENGTDLHWIRNFNKTRCFPSNITFPLWHLRTHHVHDRLHFTLTYLISLYFTWSRCLYRFLKYVPACTFTLFPRGNCTDFTSLFVWYLPSRGHRSFPQQHTAAILGVQRLSIPTQAPTSSPLQTTSGGLQHG